MHGEGDCRKRGCRAEATRDAKPRNASLAHLTRASAECLRRWPGMLLSVIQSKGLSVLVGNQGIVKELREE